MIRKAEKINWREVDSTNVARIGWDRHGVMYVEFHHGGTYAYPGVSRQRAVAATRAASVGKYIARVVKPQFPAVSIS